MFLCPNCSAELDDSAKFCRDCGADDSNGWDYHQTYESEGPEDFDYDDFVSREFDDNPKSRSWTALIVVVVLILLLLAASFR